MTFSLPQLDLSDDVDFLQVVTRIISGVAEVHRTDSLLVYRLDNWFGWKWKDFQGKILGALGAWCGNTAPVIPPFVRNRITASFQFDFDPGRQLYRFTGAAPAIHHEGPSERNTRRYWGEVVQGCSIFWYSGKTRKNAKGTLMGYIPLPSAPTWTFHIEFEFDNQWRARRLTNIGADELSDFTQRASSLVDRDTRAD